MAATIYEDFADAHRDPHSANIICQLDDHTPFKLTPRVALLLQRKLAAAILTPLPSGTVFMLPVRKPD